MEVFLKLRLQFVKAAIYLFMYRVTLLFIIAFSLCVRSFLVPHPYHVHFNLITSTLSNQKLTDLELGTFVLDTHKHKPRSRYTLWAILI